MNRSMNKRSRVWVDYQQTYAEYMNTDINERAERLTAALGGEVLNVDIGCWFGSTLPLPGEVSFEVSATPGEVETIRQALAGLIGNPETIRTEPVPGDVRPRRRRLMNVFYRAIAPLRWSWRLEELSDKIVAIVGGWDEGDQASRVYGLATWVDVQVDPLRYWEERRACLAKTPTTGNVHQQ